MFSMFPNCAKSSANSAPVLSLFKLETRITFDLAVVSENKNMNRCNTGFGYTLSDLRRNFGKIKQCN